ncbi:hypothetical protein BC829DRAFT_442887 [Chytridium lagenaria]|nr:hypothetical protein BC829DRAFT_442887 [Chytridium lagenaria]
MGDVWDPTELTSGRRPVLVIGESILLVQKDVGLYDGNTRLQDFDSGQAYVTSHRILWIDDTSQALARSLSLKDVQSVNNTGGFSIRKTLKLITSRTSAPNSTFIINIVCPICTFVNHPDMVTCEMCESPLQPPKSSISSTTSSTSSLKMESVPEKIVKLSFRSGGLNEFLKVLKSALTEKAWEKKIESPTATTPSAAMAAAGSSAGGGICDSNYEGGRFGEKERDTSLSDAFRDIDSLMAKASQMVKLAESINAKMANPQPPQILLRIKLMRFGATLLNWSSLSTKKFDRSGLLVVESADPRMGGDDAVADRVAEVIKASTIFVEKGINAFEVAEVEGVSVVMAVEMLNIAESCGRVCRDDTIEGLRFYDNIMDSFLLDSSSTLFQPGSRKGLEFS